jgi:hypothetical protein
VAELHASAVSFPQLRAASLVDPDAYRAFWAVMGMLRPPQEVYSDPDVTAAVASVVTKAPVEREAAPDMERVTAALAT